MALRSCRICGDWHDLSQPWPHNCLAHWGERPERSGLPAPMLIRDTMDAIISPLDGQQFESKSALRAAYKAAGVVEVGNDAPTTPAAPVADRVTKDEVAEALNKVKQGYKPAPLPEAAEAGGFAWCDPSA